MFRQLKEFPLYEMDKDKNIRNIKSKLKKEVYRGTSNIRLRKDGIELSRKIDKLFDDTFPELVEGKVLQNMSKYRIKKDGNIYSTYEAKNIKPATTKDGYFRGSFILDNGETKSLLVHRLIAEAFLEPDVSRIYVNHIDGNKKNNIVENLEWVTHSENLTHAVNTGLYESKQRKCKISINGVEWIDFNSIKDASVFLNKSESSIRTTMFKNSNDENKNRNVSVKYNPYRCNGYIVQYQ